jgi:hypothetical protein
MMQSCASAACAAGTETVSASWVHKEKNRPKEANDVPCASLQFASPLGLCFDTEGDYGRTGPNKRARWCRSSVQYPGAGWRSTAELIERDPEEECSGESGGQTGFTIYSASLVPRW